MKRRSCRYLALAALASFAACLLAGCSNIVGNAEDAFGSVAKMQSRRQARNSTALALGQSKKEAAP